MTIVIDDPGNTLDRIVTLYAFLSKDAEGREGLCGMPYAGTMIGMVTGSPRMADDMKPIAKILASRTGKEITLVEFTMRIDREVIKP